MTAPPEMFTVRVTFDAHEGEVIVPQLVDALNGGGPHLAKVVGVSYSDGRATIEFEPVSDDPRSGPTSLEGAMPGAEIVAALEGFSHEHSPVVPIVRALLTMSAARGEAGLPPRRRITVEAVPTPTPPQSILSTHRAPVPHTDATSRGLPDVTKTGRA